MGINFHGKTVTKVFAEYQLLSKHACDIKFVGINVRGTCLISDYTLEIIYPLYGIIIDISAVK